MTGEKDSTRVSRKRVLIAVAILAVAAVVGILLFGPSQPEEAPDRFNESVSDFWDHCKSEGGTVTVNTGDGPTNVRCENTDGTTEDYDPNDW